MSGGEEPFNEFAELPYLCAELLNFSGRARGRRDAVWAKVSRSLASMDASTIQTLPGRR